MMDKTKNLAKWIGFVITLIAIFGIASFPLNAYLTANCLHVSGSLEISTLPKTEDENYHPHVSSNANPQQNLSESTASSDFAMVNVSETDKAHDVALKARNLLKPWNPTARSTMDPMAFAR